MAESTEPDGESVAALSSVGQSQRGMATEQTTRSSSGGASKSPLLSTRKGSVTSVSDSSTIRCTDSSLVSSIRISTNRSNSTISAGMTNRSNSTISVGMDEQMRELGIELERSKAVLEEKDEEIDQLNDQIYASKAMEVHLILMLQGNETPQSTKQRDLDRKLDEVQNLKRQIAELRSLLRRAETDVKILKLEMDSPPASVEKSVEEQIEDNRCQLNDLQAVEKMLKQEKSAVKREVENIESELKSLKTIQQLADNHDIGG